MKNTAGRPRRTPMVTDCPCSEDHQLVVALKVGDQDTGCWLWDGPTNRDGYGTVHHNGRVWQAHRLSYVAFIGPIPAGLVLDHLCDTPACVNPWHLNPTTDRENILRGNGLAAIHARKTECVYGHPLRPYDGRPRTCAECARIRARAANKPGLAPNDPRHGTANGYSNRGCHCQPCRDAWAAHHKAYMDRRRAAFRSEVAA